MRKFFDSIPPDEVDYNFSTAPYIHHSKAGVICSMIGFVLAFVACGGVDTPISTMLIYGAVSIIFMVLGAVLHES